MPNRELREGILTSERINALDPMTELFYRRLMSVVDDFGRYYAHPTLLRAACFPLRLHQVADADVTAWVAECEKIGLLIIYKARGSNYLELCNFKNRKRALHSKFPAMPGAPAPEDQAAGAVPPGNASSPQKEFPGMPGQCPSDDVQMPGIDATRGEKRESIFENREAKGKVVTDSGSAGTGRHTGNLTEPEGGEESPPGVPSADPKAEVPPIRSADEEFLAELKRNPAYDGIDIDREIGKARAWLLTPKGARRTLSRQFVVNWLNRAECPIKLDAPPQKPPRREPEGWRTVTLRLYPGAPLPETFWRLTGDIQREVRHALKTA